MQTVHFPCGHCGSVMEVDGEFLGQPVRCPHCQQIVVAPAVVPPDPPPNEGPVIQTSSAETIVKPFVPGGDPEDIFDPEEPTDDLFGRSESPRIEIPPEPLAPAIPKDQSAPAIELVPDTLSASTAPEPTPSFLPNGDAATAVPGTGRDALWPVGSLADMTTPPPAEAPTPLGLDLAAESAATTTRPARRREPRTPWFAILVLSPLVLYAIVVTIFAAMLYLHQRQFELERRNPFEMMPDDGDNSGVQKEKKTTRREYRYDPRLATLPLPEDLRTRLSQAGGEPLRIGAFGNHSNTSEARAD